MFKRSTIILALGAGIAATSVCADIARGLPWNNNAADVVLEQRMAAQFPDGTPVAVLERALNIERFSMASDRGFSSPNTSEGRRSASKHVVRFRFGCGNRVQVTWQQREGRIYEVRAIVHEGCL